MKQMYMVYDGVQKNQMKPEFTYNGRRGKSTRGGGHVKGI